MEGKVPVRPLSAPLVSAIAASFGPAAMAMILPHLDCPNQGSASSRGNTDTRTLRAGGAGMFLSPARYLPESPQPQSAGPRTWRWNRSASTRSTRVLSLGPQPAITLLQFGRTLRARRQRRQANKVLRMSRICQCPGTTRFGWRMGNRPTNCHSRTQPREARAEYPPPPFFGKTGGAIF